MSEFSTPFAVERLIGGLGAAEGQLTAKMREQPFSVLLFDELEKAHPQFFDLLLQILGEGRLTDASGRVADFTNAVIVMTSNLGAESFGRGRSGFLSGVREKQAAIKHFTAAVRDFFRPEIFNRIDRIVPFAPLDEKTAGAITELEIKKLRNREGLKFRQIKLNLQKEVVQFLAQTGYDVRYGARPLGRTIERELLAPLAFQLNEHSLDEKLTINISLENNRPKFAIETDANQKKRTSANFVLAALANRAAELRRKTQKLARSYYLTELSDERFQLAKIGELSKRGRWISPEDLTRLERLPKIKNFLDSNKTFGADAAQLEDRLLLNIYGKVETVGNQFADELTINELRLEKILFDLLSLKTEQPEQTSSAVIPDLFTWKQGLLPILCFKHFLMQLNKPAIR
jgi:ATP-dependent Clp protease ATP-binding subunit ClpA